MIFEEKYFSRYFLLTDQISLPDCRYFLRQGNMYIVIVCFAVNDAINFEMYLSFLIKQFFYITKKSRQKCNYLKSEKNFSSFLKGFHLSEILSDPRVDV